jgi:NDP-sugar pyrophosphorylase family protein
MYNKIMQAIILAAGKGERMESLTIDTPKPLLKYDGKSLLHWKLDNMPDEIDEVIIVIGYFGKKIQETFGNSYKNKKITYVWDKEIKGTAMALWQTKDLLRGNFLVMMGDDLYGKEALLNAGKENWSITVKKVPHEHNGGRIELDEHGKLVNFLTAEKYRAKYTDNDYVFTGLYSLGEEIFDYPLVKMKTKDEWGLPQTLLQIVPNIDLKILETTYWNQITTSKDLK